LASLIASLRLLPRSVWLLGFISLMNDAASEMIYPLLPLFLVGTLGAGRGVLGLIEGLAEAGEQPAQARLRHLVRPDPARETIRGDGLRRGRSRTHPDRGRDRVVVRPAVPPGRSRRQGAAQFAARRDARTQCGTGTTRTGVRLPSRHGQRGCRARPAGRGGAARMGMELRTVFWCAAIPAVVVFVATLHLREPEAEALVAVAAIQLAPG
jgi:hypothetical protein